jgi:hypothetical protein
MSARARHGFDGKTEVFAPSPAVVESARAIIEAFALPENAGKGAIQLNGKMVELLHADMARRTLAITDAFAALHQAGPEPLTRAPSVENAIGGRRGPPWAESAPTRVASEGPESALKPLERRPRRPVSCVEGVEPKVAAASTMKILMVITASRQCAPAERRA